MHINDSARLTYKPMGLDDGDLMFELDNDPLVMKYINGGVTTTREAIKNLWLPRLATYRDIDKGYGIWNAFIKDSGEFIGWVLVRPMDFFNQQPKWHDIELGWRFKQSAWGKGYATEAAKQVMAAMSQQPGVECFSAIAMQGNSASINIMKKLGMSYVKTDIYKDKQLGDIEAVYYQVNNREQ